MNLEFESNLGEFSLGTISFNFLNMMDVFDEYQENYTDEDIIFKSTSEKNLKNLSTDIMEAIGKEPRLRSDLREKLIKFSGFVKGSDLITARIR